MPGAARAGRDRARLAPGKDVWDTARMARSGRNSIFRRFVRHPISVTLLLALLGLIAFRDPIATRVARSQLKKVPEVDIAFENLHISLVPAGLELSNIDVWRKAEAKPTAQSSQPLQLAHVDELVGHWRWRDLLRGAVGCDAEVTGVSASVWRVRKAPPSQKAQQAKRDTVKASVKESVKEGTPQVVPKPPEAETVAAQWPEIARFVLPFRVDSVVVRHAQFTLHDLTTEPPVHFTVDGGELTAENLTNRESLSDGTFARVRARAKPAGGTFSLQMQLDPIAPTPTFSMRSTLKGVQLPRVNPLLQAYAGLDTTAGAFDAEVGLKCEQGRYEGSIEPKIRDLAIRKRAEDPDRDTWLNRAYRTGVRAITALVKDGDSDTIATRLPLSGKFVEPKIGVWDAVVNLLANAYIEALTPDASLPGKATLKPRQPTQEQRKALKR